MSISGILTGIFEILIQKCIILKIEDLQKVDFPKLIDDAIIKALLGITSLEEIERVLFKEI